jgi:hypothetical protein
VLDDGVELIDFDITSFAMRHRWTMVLFSLGESKRLDEVEEDLECMAIAAMPLCSSSSPSSSSSEMYSS